jgi:hypothetical protein
MNEEGFTFVISQDPYFVPTEEAVEKTLAVLKVFGEECDEIAYQTWEKPKFITSGGYFEKLEQLICPACGEIHQLSEDDDKTIDWKKLKKTLCDENNDDVSQIKITLPCCHKEVSVIDLHFRNEEHFANCKLIDAGFSKFKFKLEMYGEAYIEGFENKQLVILERILGCKLAQIVYFYED